MFRVLLTRNNLVMAFYIVITSMMILTRGSDFSQNVRHGGSTVLGGIHVLLNDGLGLIKEFGDNVTRLWRMNKHYSRMQEHIVRYGYYELEFYRLSLENERLRQLLGLPQVDGYRQVQAQVITRDASNLANSFIINKGANAGLKPKMLVLAYDADRELFGVIGRVEDVFAYSAKVAPLNQRDSFLAAQLIPAGYEGLIDGGSWSGDYLFLNYVSRNALHNIAIGDLVTTSAVMQEGDEVSHIIPDLYIGEVAEIIDDPTQVSLRILVRSVIDLGRLDYLFVLIPERDAQDIEPSQLRSLDRSEVYEEYYAEQEAAGLVYEMLQEPS